MTKLRGGIKRGKEDTGNEEADEAAATHSPELMLNLAGVWWLKGPKEADGTKLWAATLCFFGSLHSVEITIRGRGGAMCINSTQRLPGELLA